MLARHQIKFAIAKGNDPPPVCKRQFETTSLSGTEYVASRRHEVPERSQMQQELRSRKINNTKTSINFGSAETKWETDAQAHQKDILSGHTLGADVERNRKLKAALTRTNFRFGDEPGQYQQVSLLPDPTGHLSEYTGVLNTEVKNMIKRSNMYFGDAKGSYTTAAHDGMELVDKSLKAGERRGPDVQRNKALKLALTRTNFKLGEEVPEYISDYKRGFTYDAEQVKNAGRAGLAQEVKDDLRRSHFEFGSDATVWETDSRRNQRCSAELR